MIRCIFLIVISLFFLSSRSQSRNAGTIDSTFILFPNPAHEQFYITTQGRVFYAMIITSKGEKKMEYLNNEIPSYQNQFGLGCTSAGCIGANIASNFICTLQRKNLENGLYYIVLFDDLGHAYYKQLILH